MNVTPDKQYLSSANLSVRLVIEPEYESNLTNLLVEWEKRWPRRPIDLLGAEAVESNVDFYHLTMEFEDGGDQQIIEVKLDYFQAQKGTIRVRRRAQRERDLRGVHGILEFLESSRIESHFHCHVDWEFPRNRFSTMISLPLMRINIPGVPFNMISGVRLSTMKQDQNVILDQTLDETATSVNCSFSFHSLWSRQIVQRVLQESRSIIDSLIIEDPLENTNDPQE